MNIFQETVERIPIDRPRQYIFTIQCGMTAEDLDREELTVAVNLLSQVGSFEIIEVEEIPSGDLRRL